MTTDYTPEERERAARQVTDFSPSFRFSELMNADGDEIENVAVVLQMRLNRLEQREAEARELLENSTRRKFGMKEHEYHARLKAWLSK